VVRRRVGAFRRRSGDRDCGSATVELAVGLPVVVILLAAALTAITAVTAQLRCVDAAREAARAAARGDPDAAAIGRRVAPAGAQVSVTTEGNDVRATVRVRVRPVGRLIDGPTVQATAVAAREPGADP